MTMIFCVPNNFSVVRSDQVRDSSGFRLGSNRYKRETQVGMSREAEAGR